MSKGRTMSLKEVLLKTLEDLSEEELKKFKWFLQDPNILKSFPVIPKYQLEKADRLDSVDKMIQTYNQQSAEVMKMILEKIQRCDLVKELLHTSAGAQGKLQEENHHVIF